MLNGGVTGDIGGGYSRKEHRSSKRKVMEKEEYKLDPNIEF